MPKCVSTGCDQTAFYGLVYNQPRFCKTHADGSGSVKKKCTWGDCSNAIGHGDICSRCNAVQVTIHSFKEMRLCELDTLIEKENMNRLRVEQVVAHSPATQATAPAAKRVPKPPDADVLKTSSLLTHRAANSAPPLHLPVPPKTKTPKIVRTPDEPKQAADPISIKKRAQTPGRVRGVLETKI